MQSTGSLETDRVEPAPAAPSATLASMETGAGRILIVEDDPPLRGLLVRVLRRAGYETVEAADAEAARTAFESSLHPFDLLLTDIVLPGESGLSTAAWASERHPALRVLYMSGYSDESIAGEDALPDASQFLQKPFSDAKLLRAVHRALDGTRTSET